MVHEMKSNSYHAESGMQKVIHKCTELKFEVRSTNLHMSRYHDIIPSFDKSRYLNVGLEDGRDLGLLLSRLGI